MSYRRCPNCDNTQDGHNIKCCDSCSLIYCTECSVPNTKFFSSEYYACPRCQSDDFRYIGEIESDD